MFYKSSQITNIEEREKMKYKVLAYLNEKGGVGKTSLTYSIAWELSKKNKVLLIDMDGQRANMSFFCKIKANESTKTMYSILMQGVDYNEAIINVKDNLDIIPANTEMASIPENAKVTTLKKVIQELKEKYDYIFYDLPPSPNRSHALALATSDAVIVVNIPDVCGLEADKGMVESITEIKESGLNPTLKVVGLLFNMNENRTTLQKDVKEAAQKISAHMDSTVFKSTIRQSVKMKECVSSHIGVTDYCPKEEIAEDIRIHIKELKERL